MRSISIGRDRNSPRLYTRIASHIETSMAPRMHRASRPPDFQSAGALYFHVYMSAARPQISRIPYRHASTSTHLLPAARLHTSIPRCRRVCIPVARLHTSSPHTSIPPRSYACSAPPEPQSTILPRHYTYSALEPLELYTSLSLRVQGDSRPPYLDVATPTSNL